MQTSETLGNFAEAMAKVQSELRPAAMNATNPFLKNRYADLGSVVDAVQKLAASHGLSVIQMAFSTSDAVGITTRILHTSGEWVEGELAFPLAEERGKSMAQMAGGLITYMRRYALASAFGVVSDEDTDGGHGAKPEQAQQAKAQPKKQAAQAYTPAFLTYAVKELGLNEGEIINRLAAQYPVPTADKTEAKARFDWLKAQIEQGL